MSLVAEYPDGTEEVLEGDWESLDETERELRQKAQLIALDLSAVPEDRRNDPQLREYAVLVSLRYRDVRFRAALALHEAAHAENTERSGVDYVQIVPMRWSIVVAS
jgi:hypothetical protein